MVNNLQIILLTEQFVGDLKTLFQVIREQGDDRFFCPHPFSSVEAEKLSKYKGEDTYYILRYNNNIAGYGMLRGWDEGYQIPSLGLYIHPRYRAQGLGQLMINFLHIAARQKGSHQIRLTVFKRNTIAISLYRKIGYTFVNEVNDALIGIYDL